MLVRRSDHVVANEIEFLNKYGGLITSQNILLFRPMMSFIIIIALVMSPMLGFSMGTYYVFICIHDRFHGKFTNRQHFIRTSYFSGQSLEEKQKQFEALKSLPFSDNPFFVRQIADSGKFEGKLNFPFLRD